MPKTTLNDFFPKADNSQSIRDNFALGLARIHEKLPSSILSLRESEPIMAAIATYVAPQDSAVPKLPTINRMSPDCYLNTLDQSTQAECTLGNAMAKFCLEKAGVKGFSSAMISGHQILAHTNDEGGLTLYDVTTRVTDENGVNAMKINIPVDKIVSREDVFDNKGNCRGTKVRVELHALPPKQGIFNADYYDSEKQVYFRYIFVSEPTTYVEPAVIIDNLAGINSVDSGASDLQTTIAKIKALADPKFSDI